MRIFFAGAILLITFSLSFNGFADESCGTAWLCCGARANYRVVSADCVNGEPTLNGCEYVYCGGGSVGGGGGGEGCDVSDPLWWVFCDPFAE